jgi:hypothetical protein
MAAKDLPTKKKSEVDQILSRLNDNKILAQQSGDKRALQNIERLISYFKKRSGKKDA